MRQIYLERCGMPCGVLRGIHEEWSNIDRQCEPSCKNPAPHSRISLNKYECLRKNGYFRNDDEDCVMMMMRIVNKDVIIETRKCVF
ncbi:hypothetical protein L596_013882 [Steinernema carpocapsae]|uniref:Uncharacterized protein n=1 Tax=Steinernema carpocapsae TaxID=34508 RepID=A0A4U5P284_STECR|nr:hypothetical protein L596_013882 [Steinernema carpocapsae]